MVCTANTKSPQQPLLKKFDVGHRSGVLDRPGGRELRAVKIPASCDFWRPPKYRKNDSGKNRFFGVSEISVSSSYHILSFVKKKSVSSFSWILEGIDYSKRQNQFPRENFAPDTPILRSVRPKIAKNRFVLREPGLCEPFPRAPNSISMVYLGFL